MNEKHKKEKQQLLEMYRKFDEFEVPEFPKKFRGYDRYEVDHYLNALVDAYNQMYEQYQKLEEELEGYRKNMDAIAEVLVEAKATAGRILSVAKIKASKTAPAKVTETAVPDKKAPEGGMAVPDKRASPIGDGIHKDFDIEEFLSQARPGAGRVCHGETPG